MAKRRSRGTGKKSPNGTHRCVMPTGYIRIWVGRDHPLANKQGHTLEHRLVASQMIGRPLLPGEEVHHRNGIRDDNRPENLQVVSEAEHKALHRRPGSNLRLPGEPNPEIECACGCGGRLLKYSPRGKPRSHLPRHSNRRVEMKTRSPGEENPMVPCACGCGEFLLKYDSSGRPRSNVRGHWWRGRARSSWRGAHRAEATATDGAS